MKDILRQEFKKRAILFSLYVLSIFALLPFGRRLAVNIRTHGILTKAVYLLTGLISLFFLRNLWQRYSHAPVKTLFTVALLLGVVATMYMTLNLPEERLHFAQYGLLGYLAGWMLKGAEVYLPSPPKRLIFGYLLTFSIGTADEIVQGILPMRVFDVHDIFWNVVSSWLGFYIYHFSMVNA